MDDFSVKVFPFRSYSAMTYSRSLSLGKSYVILAPPLIGVTVYPVKGPAFQVPPSGRLSSLSPQEANSNTMAAKTKLYFFIFIQFVVNGDEAILIDSFRCGSNKITRVSQTLFL